MLSRIYGTAFASQKELDEYLHMIEEAEKREPPRRIGKDLDLFHLQEEAQGSVFWHPKGYVLYNQMEAYIRRRVNANGYNEVKTPQLMCVQVLGSLRPLGQVPREHVQGARRGARYRGDGSGCFRGKAEPMAL